MATSPRCRLLIFERDENIGLAYGMGLTAEKVAAEVEDQPRRRRTSSRFESHRRALAAIAAGHFAAEMTPFEILERQPQSGRRFDQPERSRIVEHRRRPAQGHVRSKAWPSSSPWFAAKGSVTAGNSSQTSDGAGALIVASEAAVKRFGLTPLARFVSASQCVACRPRSWASARSRRSLPPLKLAGITAADLGWIELNEAFAAQSLAVLNDLDSKGIVLDRSKVNPNGAGAIALGHPLGATGAIRAASASSTACAAPVPSTAW